MDANDPRANQKRRTRRELLRAAARLISQGRKPSLEEIAEEALVSRATAYRYFPDLDALLLEATLDIAAPEPDALFGPDAPADPVDRLVRVDAAFEAMMAENEPALRLMLAKSLERSVSAPDETPKRQNRRTPLIEAALAPLARDVPPERLGRLKAALALLVGTESFIVFSDVLGLDESEARAVKAWAFAALVEAARR
ncbi:TetR/AcrR family transcriptional regulator [Marinicauda algicola]|uniref:TetR/AcrR family transcriptional regulator n=1 Tax=Marinicauda algicola TaxID=2029849 RepID=A0A4S2H517_9PROT|nr:TetR/AcrR family transcriptional regulator [Marinicauda algicola]TGY90734.1 TetR/AcrR family transcriptional regulator [Marinicauda algicola]